MLFFYLPGLKYVKESGRAAGAGAGHVSEDDRWIARHLTAVAFTAAAAARWRRIF